MTVGAVGDQRAATAPRARRSWRTRAFRSAGVCRRPAPARPATGGRAAARRSRWSRSPTRSRRRSCRSSRARRGARRRRLRAALSRLATPMRRLRPQPACSVWMCRALMRRTPESRPRRRHSQARIAARGSARATAKHGAHQRYFISSPTSSRGGPRDRSCSSSTTCRRASSRCCACTTATRSSSTGAVRPGSRRTSSGVRRMNLGALDRLTDILRREQPAIVHSYRDKANFWARLAAARGAVFRSRSPAAATG